MDRAAIQKKLLAELGSVLKCTLTEKDAAESLRSLGVDSLSMVELFVIVEREFNIKLMEAGLGKDDLTSIDALSTAISRL